MVGNGYKVIKHNSALGNFLSVGVQMHEAPYLADTQCTRLVIFTLVSVTMVNEEMEQFLPN